MKIAVVSDIHGNLPALKAVLEDIRAEGVDQVVNLGDILSGPLLPAETADFLMQRDWVTIAGNHERQLLEVWGKGAEHADPATSDGFAATKIDAAQAHWLRALAPGVWLGSEVLLVHGTPTTDLQYWLEDVTPDFGTAGSSGMRPASAQAIRNRLHAGGEEVAQARVALCGHSHVPRVVQCDKTLIVNPGSVGLQAYESGEPHYHQMEMGAPHARYAIVERRRGNWQARLCAVAYDWIAASDIAVKNGRREWAYALTTGRMPAWARTMHA